MSSHDTGAARRPDGGGDRCLAESTSEAACHTLALMGAVDSNQEDATTATAMPRFSSHFEVGSLLDVAP